MQLCVIRRWKSKNQFSSPELCHSFTFYAYIGVKGRVLSPLSLKCASNEHRGSVRDTLDYHFPPSDLGCRGTTLWLPGVGDTFRPLQSPTPFNPPKKLSPGAGREPSGLFVSTLGRGLWIRINLAHVNPLTKEYLQRGVILL